MDILVLIGRVLFAVLFVVSGYEHVTKPGGMVGYAAAKGVPAARLAVPAGGALLTVGGLMVLLGIWADLGFLLILLFLVPTMLLMHAFWRESDPDTRQQEMIQFNKDLALAGASLMLFVLFAHADSDLGLTLTGPAFELG